MSSDYSVPSSVRLQAFNPQAAEIFRSLRSSLQSSGPLDEKTCELIVMAAMAVTGLELSFKSHVLKARKSGIKKEAIQHAVAVTLGAVAPIMRVTDALRWIDEVESGLPAASS